LPVRDGQNHPCWCGKRFNKKVKFEILNTEIENLLERVRQLRRTNKPDQIPSLIKRAYGLCENGDAFSLGKIHSLQAQFMRDQGALIESKKYYNQALDCFEKLNLETTVAHTLRHIADVERELGEVDDANDHYQKALNMYRSGADTSPLDLANALRGYALLHEDMDHKEKAKAMWKEAMMLYQKSKISEGVQECESHLAKLG
jgi:tetratricopeptide (TPR) repeat protein